MQRFKKYIGKELLVANVRAAEQLERCGFVCSSMPDSIGDFEEIEFSCDLADKKLLLCVAVLKGTIKRIMFVKTPVNDPDDVSPLTEAELQELLEKNYETLSSFFDHITR